MEKEQESAKNAGDSQCKYYVQLGELLPMVRKVEQDRSYEDVLALYKWCSKQSDMQYVVLAQYVVRALETLVEQPIELPIRQLERQPEGDLGGQEMQQDGRLAELLDKFMQISWITREEILRIRLQQVLERQPLYI